MKYLLALLFLGFAFAVEAPAQTPQTVGLITHTPASYDSGYVLFSPITYTATYLIDKCGKVVHSWNSKFLPGESCYLRPDGTLARAGVLDGGSSKQLSGCTEIYDWDGKLIWTYTLDSLYGQHHDFEVMPNGNILIISHELIPTATAIADGRDSNLISGNFVSEKLVELQPLDSNHANIVWEWHVFDHLVQDFNSTAANYGVVANHPELVNVNFPKSAVGEWLHFNSVRYNKKFDQIMVSAHHSSEIWIIDHSTTTLEAASHKGGKRGKGGDLLYRWGNPQAYNHGTPTNEMFFGEHECGWIPDSVPLGGKILVFNNGTGRPSGMYATVDVITPPVDSVGNYNTATLPELPAAEDWSYVDTTILTQTAGGSQMLSDGHIVVCTGQQGSMFELDSTHTSRPWYYIVPVNSAGPLQQGVKPSGNPVYKTVFYPFDYPAFTGKVLTAGLPIETGPVNYTCFLDTGTVDVHQITQPTSSVLIYPNPAKDHLTILDNEHISGVALYDALGAKVLAADNSGEINIAQLPAGVYRLVVSSGRMLSSKMVAIVR